MNRFAAGVWGSFLLSVALATGAAGTASAAPAPCIERAADLDAADTDARVFAQLLLIARCGWQFAGPEIEKDLARADSLPHPKRSERGEDAPEDSTEAPELGEYLDAVLETLYFAGSPEAIVLNLSRADATAGAILRDDEMARAVGRMDDAMAPLLVAIQSHTGNREVIALAELMLAMNDARRGDWDAFDARVARARAEEIAAASMPHTASEDAGDEDEDDKLSLRLLEFRDEFQNPERSEQPQRWVLDPPPRRGCAYGRLGSISPADAEYRRGNKTAAIRTNLIDSRAGLAKGVTVDSLFVWLVEQYGAAGLRDEWKRAQATIYRNERSAGWTFLGVALPLPVGRRVSRDPANAGDAQFDFGPNGGLWTEEALSPEALAQLLDEGELGRLILNE